MLKIIPVCVVLFSACATPTRWAPSTVVSSSVADDAAPPRLAASSEPQHTRRYAIESALLSRFYGRTKTFDVDVVLPPTLEADAPTIVCYQVLDHDADADRQRVELARRVASGDVPAMIYVLIDGGGALAHHGCADSVNNGPWGQALVVDLIPELETRLLGRNSPSARYVCGIGLGGWSSVWLQTNYPHVFDGTWAVAPDPLTFDAWLGADLRTADNVYRDASGARVRVGPRSLRELLRGELEARVATWEAIYGPRTDEGGVFALFDRDEGDVDSTARDAWRKFDVLHVLHERAPLLVTKLRGKLHVWCARDDVFGRDRAVSLLADQLARDGFESDVRVDGSAPTSTMLDHARRDMFRSALRPEG